MKKLVVMYTVDRTNPKGTWSGTSYSLTSALRKKFDISVVDLHEGIVLTFLNRAKRYVPGLVQPVVGMLYDKILEWKAAFLLRDYKGTPVLEIANEVRIRKPYYIYQDLTLAVLSQESQKLRKLGITGGGIRTDWSENELHRKISIQKRIYDTVEASFFIGKWVSDRMKLLYPELRDKFYFAGGGLNEEFRLPESLSIDDKEQIVLFIGIDFERKGGDLVLRAFCRMREMYHSKAELYIAGPENLNVSKYQGVHFLGKASREQLSKILKKSTVFCMPSRFEAYGLVFPEAMCYGNLCIGRNCYEMPYFIDLDVGQLIESDEIDVLAEKMNKLLQDKAALKKAIDIAPEKRNYYSWEAVAERISKVVNALPE